MSQRDEDIKERNRHVGRCSFSNRMQRNTKKKKNIMSLNLRGVKMVRFSMYIKEVNP